MTDQPKDFSEVMRRMMRTIRDKTAEEVRRKRFAEKKIPEQIRREEEILGSFNAVLDPLCGDEPSEGEE